MTKEEKRRQTLDRIKEYVNREMYNPFKVEVDVKEDDGNLTFDCGVCVVTMGIVDDWFNVSTKEGCGIGFYDLDQIVEIRNNKGIILDLYNGAILMTQTEVDKSLESILLEETPLVDLVVKDKENEGEYFDLLKSVEFNIYNIFNWNHYDEYDYGKEIEDWFSRNEDLIMKRFEEYKDNMLNN